MPLPIRCLTTKLAWVVAAGFAAAYFISSINLAALYVGATLVCLFLITSHVFIEHSTETCPHCDYQPQPRAATDADNTRGITLHFSVAALRRWVFNIWTALTLSAAVAILNATYFTAYLAAGIQLLPLVHIAEALVGIHGALVAGYLFIAVWHRRAWCPLCR